MKYFFTAIIIILGTQLVFSQSALKRTYWGYTYDVSFPTGKMTDYIRKPSFLGFGIQTRSSISPKFTIGGSFNWHVFHKKVEEVREFRLSDELLNQDITGAISGKQYRYQNTFPLQVNFHYYLKDLGLTPINAYVGLGLGTTIIHRRLEIGVFSVEENNWHFSFAPEIGILTETSGPYQFMAALKFQNALKAGETPHQSYLNFQIGALVRI